MDRCNYHCFITLRDLQCGFKTKGGVFTPAGVVDIKLSAEVTMPRPHTMHTYVTSKQWEADVGTTAGPDQTLFSTTVHSPKNVNCLVIFGLSARVIRMCMLIIITLSSFYYFNRSLFSRCCSVQK